MTEKELIRRALMGDKQAQEECTEKGIVLPCPFCGGEAALIEEAGLYSICCKDGTCIGSDIHPEYGELIYALTDWNTRPAPPVGRCEDCKWYVVKKPKCCGYCKLIQTTFGCEEFCSYFDPREESR